MQSAQASLSQQNTSAMLSRGQNLNIFIDLQEEQAKLAETLKETEKTIAETLKAERKESEKR